MEENNVLNEEINYESMTVVELKEIAKQKAIYGCSSMNKAELIESIKASV